MIVPKIVDIEVDWKLGWENGPELRVLVTRRPKDDEKLYIRDAKGIYWCVVGDIVEYYFHGDPPEENAGGFYGRVYELKMRDGTTVRLVGPWSSRAGCVNESFAPTVDVVLTDDPRVMQRGHTFSVGAVTLEAVNWWLLKNCRRMSTLWGMARHVDNQGEIVWAPKRLDGGNCPTCKGFKKIPPMMEHRIDDDLMECPRCHGMGSVRHESNQSVRGDEKGRLDSEGYESKGLKEI